MTRLSQFKAYSLTADPNFEVVGCNGADNIPELTLRIKRDYFETNLSWQTGFTLTGQGPWNGTKTPPHSSQVERSDSKQVWTRTRRDPGSP